MTLQPQDPNQYLSEVSLLESELVRFDVQAKFDSCDFIINYTAETLGRYFEHLERGLPASEFHVDVFDCRWLSFRDLSHVNVANLAPQLCEKGGTRPEWQIVRDAVRASPRPRLITGWSFDKVDGHFRSWFEIESIGEVLIIFAELCTAHRILEPLSNDEHTMCRDRSSGKIVSRLNPFPEFDVAV